MATMVTGRWNKRVFASDEQAQEWLTKFRFTRTDAEEEQYASRKGNIIIDIKHHPVDGRVLFLFSYND